MSRVAHLLVGNATITRLGRLLQVIFLQNGSSLQQRQRTIGRYVGIATKLLRMELDIVRMSAVTTAAGSLSRFATHAILFGLLRRACNVRRVGMRVETVAFSAIGIVRDMKRIFTERAGLVPRSGTAVTVTR